MEIAELSTTEMAIKAVEADTTVTDMITMVTGAVVKVSPMKDRLALKLYQKFPEPKPPVVHIKQDGKEWDESNPNDPDFLAAKELYKNNTYEAYTKIVLMTCVTVISLPEGMLSFDEDTEWIEEMQMLGFSGEYSNRLERYMDWLTYRVVISNADMGKIQDMAAKLAGVTEEEIKAAEASFRDSDR